MMMSMLHYQVLWYALVGLVMVVFALTAGADLGIGIMLPFAGKNNIERRVILNSIGPTWDGNQVWLIFAGGALFVIWSAVYALVFSGMYGVFLIILWSMFLRPTAFEWRSKMPSGTWTSFWDGCLFLGSLIPAFMIGLVLGNLVQGVPFHYEEALRVYYTGNFLDLFNWYACLTGLLSVCMVTLHGSVFLQLRTEGDILKRCRRTTYTFAILYLIMFCLCGWLLNFLTGYHLVHAAGINNPSTNIVDLIPAGAQMNFVRHPWISVAPALGVFGAIIAIIATACRWSLLKYLASACAVIGTVLVFGFSMFPFIVPSITDPAHSLTAYNATASIYTMQTIFIASFIMIPIILCYTAYVYIKTWRRLSTNDVAKEDHYLY